MTWNDLWWLLIGVFVGPAVHTFFHTVCKIVMNAWVASRKGKP